MMANEYNLRSVEKVVNSVDLETGKFIMKNDYIKDEFVVRENSVLAEKYPVGQNKYHDGYTQDEIEYIEGVLTDEYNAQEKTVAKMFHHKHIIDSVRLVNPKLESQLREKVIEFMDKNGITCVETIYQTDRVIENALEFIEQLYDIVKEEVKREED